MRSSTYIAEMGSLRKKRKVIFLLTVFGAICFALALIVGIFMFRSSLFMARDISIEGVSQVSQDEVMTFLEANIVKGFWGRMAGFRNMFVWPDEIGGENLVSLAGVKSISIQKDYLKHRIIVTVVERPMYGVWCTEQSEERCFWFDDQGVMFKKALATEGRFIRRVKDSSGVSLGMGSVVLPPRFLPALFSVFTVLERSNLPVSEIDLADIGLEEISVLTLGGPKVLFSLRFLANEAFSGLEALAEKPGLGALSAIDFRTAHRVFYK